MTILVVSVVFGFITVFAGLLASGLQKVRMKKYAEAYNSGFAWCYSAWLVIYCCWNVDA